MRKVYGPSLRKEAGLTKTIKKMAIKNARMLNATPEIRRVAQEFRGTVEKVYEDATDVLEDFISKCTSILINTPCRLTHCFDPAAPKFSDAVQDAKFLLQQSTERLVITFVLLSFCQPSPTDLINIRSTDDWLLTSRHMTCPSTRYRSHLDGLLGISYAST